MIARRRKTTTFSIAQEQLLPALAPASPAVPAPAAADTPHLYFKVGSERLRNNTFPPPPSKRATAVRRCTAPHCTAPWGMSLDLAHSDAWCFILIKKNAIHLLCICEIFVA